MATRISNFWAKFRSDERGTFAVWFAIFALPLLVIVTVVIDVHRAHREEAVVLSAMDSAAIAAVQAGTMSDKEREAFARELFDKNYQGIARVRIGVTSTGDTITVTGDGEIPTSIAGAVGINKVSFEKSTKAVRTEKDVICVLALDETSPRALSFQDNASFTARNCSVQVNSKHAQAIFSSITTPPIANSFCAVGETVGDYSPFAKELCSAIPDPYKDRKAGATPSCEADLPGGRIPPALVNAVFTFPSGGGNGNGGGQGNGGGPKAAAMSTGPDAPKVLSVNAINAVANQLNIRGTLDADDLANIVFESDDSLNVIGDDVVIYPGTFCGGLTVIGQNVQFMPGKYTMLNGKLNFKRSASASGSLVTFVHSGLDSILRIEEDAEVNFTAQDIATAQANGNGGLAGFVFFQDVSALPLSGALARTSEISGNGRLNLTGTLYLPEQDLVVNGSGDIGSKSPILSFIAKRITFAGDATVTINVDEDKVNYPSVLPRSDEGARLMR